MGAAVVPIVVFTAFWGVVGIVLPFVVPKGPNRGTYSSPVASLVLTDSSQLTAKSFEKLPNQIMYPYAEAYDLQKLVFSSFHSRQSKFRIFQVVLMLTAATCWLLCDYKILINGDDAMCTIAYWRTNKGAVIKYRGPLVVLKVFPDGNTYRVSHLTGDVKQRHYATTGVLGQQHVLRILVGTTGFAIRVLLQPEAMQLRFEVPMTGEELRSILIGNDPITLHPLLHRRPVPISLSSFMDPSHLTCQAASESRCPFLISSSRSSPFFLAQ
uniref:Uncharacterized protein n=1 Tax=Timema poppense TaxID=170557 RepID=A0A7R9DGU4_TIMPO|nr:unnamed protein product [Timema poppensis]